MQNRVQDMQNICFEEDEIDLRELFNTIWKNKFKIIVFSFIVTVASIVYTLKMPNIYESKSILVPTSNDGGGVNLGGLGALAGLAGINIGGGGGKVDTLTKMKTIFDDYRFRVYIIKKYDLVKKLLTNVDDKNYVFALGIDSVYRFFNKKDKKENKKSQDELIFDTAKILEKTIDISSDKKTGLIEIKAENPDRFFAKYLVEIIRNEIVQKLKTQDMRDLEEKISYYKKELSDANSIELRDQLSKLVSSLIQKRVLSNASKYYVVEEILSPYVSNKKDKIKPKRALIIGVVFVISVLLVIPIASLVWSIKNNDEKND